MGFLQNSIPTVTTSIMQCCLSVTAFPFASLLDLALPGFDGIPLLWGWGAPLCAAWLWAPQEELPGTGEQEGWHRVAAGLRTGGDGPPALQQSKRKGTSLTTLGGSLQEAAVLCFGIPKPQPLLSVLSQGQRGST